MHSEEVAPDSNAHVQYLRNRLVPAAASYGHHSVIMQSTTASTVGLRTVGSRKRKGSAAVDSSQPAQGTQGTQSNSTYAFCGCIGAVALHVVHRAMQTSAWHVLARHCMQRAQQLCRQMALKTAESDAKNHKCFKAARRCSHIIFIRWWQAASSGLLAA
jgi:hypothetical protein